MTADASDLSLVQRVQRGDKGAFDVLVLKYQHKVVKLVMRYVRNPAEAEDIAHQIVAYGRRAIVIAADVSKVWGCGIAASPSTPNNAVVSTARHRKRGRHGLIVLIAVSEGRHPDPACQTPKCC